MFFCVEVASALTPVVRKGLFGALATTEKVLSYVLLGLGAAVSVPKDMF